jgi:hypothetical protein
MSQITDISCKVFQRILDEDGMKPFQELIRNLFLRKNEIISFKGRFTQKAK